MSSFPPSFDEASTLTAEQVVARQKNQTKQRVSLLSFSNGQGLLTKNVEKQSDPPTQEKITSPTPEDNTNKGTEEVEPELPTPQSNKNNEGSNEKEVEPELSAQQNDNNNNNDEESQDQNKSDTTNDENNMGGTHENVSTTYVS